MPFWFATITSSASAPTTILGLCVTRIICLTLFSLLYIELDHDILHDYQDHLLVDQLK